MFISKTNSHESNRNSAGGSPTSRRSNLYPLVSISLVVRNGEKYIRDCLRSVKDQTHDNLELTVWDNNSGDRTKEIIKKEFPEFRLIEHRENIGFGPAQNRCLEITKGEYVLGLCVDVALNENFVAKAVEVMKSDKKIGALQAKIYKTENGRPTNIIDTTGFEIFKSRRVVNRGHGEKDAGQYDQAGEVFSYEGAVPFWRREAMENSKVCGQAHDEDYFWYADDIDLGWRMRLFGWKSFYSPGVIAYHDRSTTKRLSRNPLDFVRLRRTVPARKRMLDWQNLHLTFIKNDFCLSALKDLWPYAAREIKLLVYVLLFEQYTLLAIPKIIFLLPQMLKKRRYIMEHKKVSRAEIEKWFQ